MKKILKKEFFNRSALDIAPELLGKYLVRKVGKKETALKITEVEAYDGHEDKASHAHKGKTERTEVMFGEPGVWYVYLIYGMYNMLNIVTGPKEYPAAILVRGVESINGPGKLTRELKITRSLNKKVANKASGLWIEDRGEVVVKNNIKKTPRIGVSYAEPVWSKKHYRFVLKKNPASAS